MKCATHPNVETNLSCGKCGNPICPRCMVQTPVGARCPRCARLYKLPTYRVSAAYYLRAAAAALGISLAGGIAWGLLMAVIPFFLLSLLIAAGIGYIIAEVISLSVNRKRGTGLAVIAGTAVVASYAVSYLFTLVAFGRPGPGLMSIFFALVSIGLGVFFAVNRFR